MADIIFKGKKVKKVYLGPSEINYLASGQFTVYESGYTLRISLTQASIELLKNDGYQYSFGNNTNTVQTWTIENVSEILSVTLFGKSDKRIILYNNSDEKVETIEDFTPIKMTRELNNYLIECYSVVKSASCIDYYTQVEMADNTFKNLGDIEVGDEVLSIDFDNEQLVARSVKYSGRDEPDYDEWYTDQYIQYIFSNGSVIKQSERHRMYNLEAEMYKHLYYWNTGEHSYSREGENPELLSIKLIPQRQHFARITLEDSNNYFANGLSTGDSECPTDIILDKPLYKLLHTVTFDSTNGVWRDIQDDKIITSADIIHGVKIIQEDNCLIINSRVYQFIPNEGAISKFNYTSPITQNQTITVDTVAAENYVKFSSPNSFTLSFDGTNDGTVEYSTDNSTWTSWNTSTTISSASDGTTHNIYLRGTNNTYFKARNISASVLFPDSFTFSGSNISVSGNLECLLDYQTVANGGHPTYGTNGDWWIKGTFGCLFYGCSNLVDASGLTLGNETIPISSCYYYMFYNCYNLTTPPQLPATTLAEGCYYYMFSYCSSLTTLPKLPATTLANSCYEDMFYRCSNIKLSTTQIGAYQYEYRIPTTGTGTSASSALSNMFNYTGGTFTGTPTINTTYYTDHEPV